MSKCSLFKCVSNLTTKCNFSNFNMAEKIQNGRPKP